MLAGARAPWWVIGSAAVALHGAPVTPCDVDVLVSEADATSILPTAGIHPTPGRASARFRSTLFARSARAPLPIEWMAGLHLATPHGWSPVLPVTRACVRVGAVAVYVPARDELIAILRRFGRRKDLARAALLA